MFPKAEVMGQGSVAFALLQAIKNYFKDNPADDGLGIPTPFPTVGKSAGARESLSHNALLPMGS